MPTTLDRISFRPGTLDLLRTFHVQVADAFGLDAAPSYTALLIAGARALLFQADDLNKRPYADSDKLAVWSLLCGGISLPSRVDKTVSLAEARRLLGGQPVTLTEKETREEARATA